MQPQTNSFCMVCGQSQHLISLGFGWTLCLCICNLDFLTAIDKGLIAPILLQFQTVSLSAETLTIDPPMSATLLWLQHRLQLTEHHQWCHIALVEACRELLPVFLTVWSIIPKLHGIAHFSSTLNAILEILVAWKSGPQPLQF